MRITSRDLLFLCFGALFAFLLIPSEKENQAPSKSHSAVQGANAATPTKDLIRSTTLTDKSIQNTDTKKNSKTLSKKHSKYEKLGYKELKLHSIQAKTVPSHAKLERTPQSLDLILKENDILTLENALHSLRHQVWTKLTKNGWRLYGPINTTPLAHAGFQAGDVVTFASIHALKNSSEHFVLTERFETILRSLER